VISGRALAPGTAVKRFHREARAAAKLHHTNIIPIYAEGEERGICYYAMEMLLGRPLDRVIKELRALKGLETDRDVRTKKALTTLSAGLQWQDAEPEGSRLSRSTIGHNYYDFVANLVAEAAEALHYAHGQGVVHRDVKPANLMLTPEGHLVLMDFGLARLLEEQRMTLTGAFMGTPHYMSPEQITGQHGETDHRIDVYSLGATLYELLTLEPPFSGKRYEQISHQILNRDPIKPRHLDEHIPVDLQTICLKALEKSPTRRYATAGALADDLHRFLNRYVIKAKKAGPCDWMIKFTRRHKVSVALTGVIMVVLLVAGSMTWKYQRLQWAQKHTIPAIVEMVEENKFFDALIMARKAEKVAASDPTLQDLWTRLSRQHSIYTMPAGAGQLGQWYLYLGPGRLPGRGHQLV
jgi:eukaryotic-like serine/threonine-protein kinase